MRGTVTTFLLSSTNNCSEAATIFKAISTRRVVRWHPQLRKGSYLIDKLRFELVQKLQIQQILRGKRFFSHDGLHSHDIFADGIVGIALVADLAVVLPRHAVPNSRFLGRPHHPPICSSTNFQMPPPLLAPSKSDCKTVVTLAEKTVDKEDTAAHTAY